MKRPRHKSRGGFWPGYNSDGLLLLRTQKRRRVLIKNSSQVNNKQDIAQALVFFLFCFGLWRGGCGAGHGVSRDDCSGVR